MEEPWFVAEALAWCNEMRAEEGKRPLKKLPKGTRDDSKSCPCAKATGLRISHTRWETMDGREDGCLPRSVIDFVFAFDDGELPQYDEAKTLPDVKVW